jgi:hypothetical protein
MATPGDLGNDAPNEPNLGRPGQRGEPAGEAPATDKPKNKPPACRPPRKRRADQVAADAYRLNSQICRTVKPGDRPRPQPHDRQPARDRARLPRGLWSGCSQPSSSSVLRTTGPTGASRSDRLSRPNRMVGRDDGGGGNRTRVRGRTGESVYKRSLGFRFARRPAPRRPTDGLAILWCPASGDWHSLGGKPVC